MIQQAIQKAVKGADLTMEEAKGAMNEIMSGQATQAQIGAFLTALRMKGETIGEITACAMVMREKGEKLMNEDDVIDIVGTGGDCANTFNISTVSSIVVAAAGVKVAKHGNRAVSSKCGAADVLEALGVKLELTPAQSQEVLNKTGICFMFAPVYHKSMKYAAGPRKELGIRTIFNILGPLSNPAGAKLQILGAYDETLLEPLARVLGNLGVKRAMCVYGRAGLDEISACGETKVCELNEGRIHKYILRPEDFGLKTCELSDLTGGRAEENAGIATEILKGAKGPKRDAVLMNSAAALYLSGVSGKLTECVDIAAGLIDGGSALRKLREFADVANSFGN